MALCAACGRHHCRQHHALDRRSGIGFGPANAATL